MEKYLQTAKANIDELVDKKLHIVLGNQSCDLDSIVSAVTYAFFRNQDAAADEIVVPLLDITREKLALRPEVALLLSELGIASDLLLVPSDVDLTATHAAGKLSVTLVDHNVVAQHVNFLSCDVCEIIDHHQEPEGRQRSDNVSYNIEMVGSCATLIGERMLSSAPQLVTEPVAMALLGTILLDTVNLDSEAGRATEKDCEIADLLGEICGQEKGQDLYKRLRNAKFDMRSLSAFQALGHDYKPLQSSTVQLGVSSITMNLEEFFGREDVKVGLEQFLDQQKLKSVVIMAIFFPEGSDSVNRQIAVFSKSSSDHKAVVDALYGDGILQLESFELSSSLEHLAVFNQANRSASRKVLLPLLAKKLSNGQEMLAPEKADKLSFSSATDSASEGAALLSPPRAAAAVLPAESEQGRSPSPIPEFSLEDEAKRERSWRAVGVEGISSAVDMSAIEDYRHIVSHGGYHGPDSQAIIVISACYLPPKNLTNYTYVMDQLFLYVLSTIQHLAVDKFCLIYFNSGTGRSNTPGITWLRKYYQCLDRSIRKNLQELYIVHPTLRLKVLIHLTRPFISSKFWRKLRFVASVSDLAESVKLDQVHVPPSATLTDRQRAVPSNTTQEEQHSPQDSGSGSRAGSAQALT